MSNFKKRFTFDQSWLLSGFDLITVLFGLFAVSQVFILLIGNDKRVSMPSLKGKKSEGFFDLIKYKTVAFNFFSDGSDNGNFSPGVGEFLAQFFSYNIARGFLINLRDLVKGLQKVLSPLKLPKCRSSCSHDSTFSTWYSWEALTAKMLSVFYVHSIIPGPDLFVKNIDFVYGLYESLIVINIIVMIFLLFATKYLLKIIQIPQRFLGFQF
ncbi:MAG: hypothetical protein Ct9H300mP4_16210 [Gammaproteobacteria bacterium]|nr:MAG: hypothetical protein Ct9H300mP4_16210 [Gammaproteobacteria bacterium]